MQAAILEASERGCELHAAGRPVSAAEAQQAYLSQLTARIRQLRHALHSASSEAEARERAAELSRLEYEASMVGLPPMPPEACRVRPGTCGGSLVVP
jgi:hypothetical protein